MNRPIVLILKALHSAAHGRAPVREFLPYLMDLVFKREINPGKAFDLELSLADVAKRYLAMDDRRAINTLLRVSEKQPSCAFFISLPQPP